MAKQLLGKEVTAALNERIKANVAELQGKGVNPTLCIIRVGENPSDISYERGATKRCETLGVACEKILLPGDVTQEELLATIDKVNKDDHIHGVLLFRPLPKHLDQAVIENALAAEKDVDCMTDLSMSGVYHHVHHRHAWKSLTTTESTAQVKKPLLSEEALLLVNLQQ